jgi:DNA-binding phage protein
MKLVEWDMADNFNSKEEVYAYLEAALAENNLETLFDVIGAIARSTGIIAYKSYITASVAANQSH